jgi:hypothetical protein
LNARAIKFSLVFSPLKSYQEAQQHQVLALREFVQKSLCLLLTRSSSSSSFVISLNKKQLGGKRLVIWGEFGWRF